MLQVSRGSEVLLQNSIHSRRCPGRQPPTLSPRALLLRIVNFHLVLQPPRWRGGFRGRCPRGPLGPARSPCMFRCSSGSGRAARAASAARAALLRCFAAKRDMSHTLLSVEGLCRDLAVRRGGRRACAGVRLRALARALGPGPSPGARGLGPGARSSGPGPEARGPRRTQILA